MMILINICDYATGANYSYMLETSTTLLNLKEKFSAIKGGTIKVKDIRAWSGSPLVNDDNTLEESNLAYNDIVINMATDWSEDMKAILPYYQK
jgi:hypothetical protein